MYRHLRKLDSICTKDAQIHNFEEGFSFMAWILAEIQFKIDDTDEKLLMTETLGENWIN